jgi:tetratricopeptide (TPR) repeat protein
VKYQKVNSELRGDYNDITDLIELYLIAKDLSDKGLSSEAIEVYSRILELNRNEIKALKSRAELYDQNTNFINAVEDYDRLIEIDPFDSEVYHDKANSLFQIDGREIESIDSYNKAISLDPVNFKVYNNRGRTLKALNRIGEATKDFDYVISQTTIRLSNSAEKERFYYLRGWAKMKKEEFNDAIDDFNKALEIDPTYRSALESRKDCSKRIKDYQGVLEDCNKLIRIDKYKKHKYLFDRAFAKDEIEDYQGAIDDYTFLIQYEMKSNNITIHSCWSYNNRGVCKEKLEDLEGALEDFETALKTKPDDELYLKNVKRVKEKLLMSNIDDDLPF